MGWQRDDGRTLFAVGDPMQSIYRFRGADVGLFLDVRNRGLGDLRLEPLTLAVNFRSTRPVIDWINTHFARVLPATDDEATGSVSYTPSTGADAAGEEGGVQVHALLRRSRLHEAACIADIVERTLAEDDSASVAILVQGRSHLVAIVAEFARRGVPFQATDIDPLGERPVVLDLLALTRAIAHPADRPAWLAVLRAPWCGLTLEQLHARVRRRARCNAARTSPRLRTAGAPRAGCACQARQGVAGAPRGAWRTAAFRPARHRRARLARTRRPRHGVDGAGARRGGGVPRRTRRDRPPRQRAGGPRETRRGAREALCAFAPGQVHPGRAADGSQGEGPAVRYRDRSRARATVASRRQAAAAVGAPAGSAAAGARSGTGCRNRCAAECAVPVAREPRGRKAAAGKAAVALRRGDPGEALAAPLWNVPAQGPAGRGSDAGTPAVVRCAGHAVARRRA